MLTALTLNHLSHGRKWSFEAEGLPGRLRQKTEADNLQDCRDCSNAQHPSAATQKYCMT